MPRLTRRQLGTAVAALVAAPALSAAGDDKPARQPVDALLELVQARYGKQLDEAKLKLVRDGLRDGLASAARLRKTKAADEPTVSYSADLP